MAYGDDDAVWLDAFPGEPAAQKVRRIVKSTGWSVQDVATKLGLNRTGPSTEKAQERAPAAWWSDLRRSAEAREKAQKERAEAAAARRSADLWERAQKEHAAHEARRERANGKAGRGHPKVDRARVFELHAEGLGVRAIARELGCSHVAVMKILKTGGNQ